MIRVGVISDTHGLLRPEVINAFEGVDQIIHAGDIDTLDVLSELEKIAPVVAVRGNMDRGGLARRLPKTEVVQIEGHVIYVLHNIHTLDLDPEAAKFDTVIYGHSHRHAMDRQNGVLYLNPGGAGYRRFDYPISAAFLHIGEKGIHPEIFEFDV